MIKCSICSYQCDNWYSSNRKIACHANFSLGRSFLELARGHLTCCPGIALRWVRHTLRGNQTLNLLAFQPCQLNWMIWYASWLTCATWESIGPFELSVGWLDLSAPMPRYCGVRTFQWLAMYIHNIVALIIHKHCWWQKMIIVLAQGFHTFIPSRPFGYDQV